MKKQPFIFDSDDESEILVQIDESSFGKRQKYHRGKYNRQQWVFGISQPEKHKCMLIVVEDRTAETLLGLIQRHVPITSHIRVVSDGWASYSQLNKFFFGN